MNVLIYASSASHQLSNAFRSVLSPFYTVQSIVPGSLATQPWTASCALLVLSSDNSPAPLSLPRSAHEAIQDYVTAGGRILGVGLGVSCLPHRPGRDRFDLWDARSSTAIVPESPQDVSARSPPSSILLRTGTSLSGLRPAGVSFELTRIASDNKIVLGHWEEDNGAVAGIQVPIGFGNAAFWDVSPHLDGIEDTASVLALLRYALTSLDLMVPPETIPDGSLGPTLTPIPRRPLPQFLLHPPGNRHIAETVLRGLGLPNATAESSDDSVLGVIKDTADTFHFHKVATLEDAARLMAEAREVSAAGTSSPHAAMAMTDVPRIVVVLPPDVLPARDLTPQFDARKYFDVLASVRGDKVSDADNWGMGEALLYGEAVTSTQTMLDRYVPPLRSRPPQPYIHPPPSRPLSPQTNCSHPPKCTGTRGSRHLSLRQSYPSPHPNSQGADAAPTRGSRHRGACKSPSSSAHLCARRRSPRIASSSCSILPHWPSSARAATSARWAPRRVHACGSSGLTTCTSTCPRPRRRRAARGRRSAVYWSTRASRTGTYTSSSVRCVMYPRMFFARVAVRMLTNGVFLLSLSCAGKGWGINVCTPAPVTALSLLSRPGERLDVETVLALILTEFERLWNGFVAGQGSWAPFEEDYLDAWMHSYVFCPICIKSQD